MKVISRKNLVYTSLSKIIIIPVLAQAARFRVQ